MPPATKIFVYSFLAVFLVAGLGGVDDAWPIAGWQLFSRVRSERQAGWQAVTVDGAGVERGIPFSSLPRGYRGGAHLFARFDSFSPDRREVACRALATAVREHEGGQVRAVRVYLLVRRRFLRLDHRPETVRRTLRYECART